MKSLEEPLELSAPIAWRLAPSLCFREAAGGDSCAWIHGLWQYLRIMGLGSSPAQHVNFYREAFGEFAGGAAPRVLVSGAADYGMLACVLAVCRERSVEPEITVVDRCETPLMLNRWYAERVFCRISTLRRDMLEYAEPQAFDVICTHSFFSELPPAQRGAMLAAWHRLLRPGGAVVTANRVRPAGDSAPVGFDAAQACAFRDTVLRRAGSMRDTLQADPEELARAAGLYASRRRAYPLRSREEIQALFEVAGFRMQRLALSSPADTADAAVTGPTTPGTAQYACIVARRP